MVDIPAATATAQGAGLWQVLPPSPIDMAQAQTGVWTGREALFTFPSRKVRAAAAYNPVTNRWRQLPGTPGPPVIVEGGDRSVWTGREWLVLGQSAPSGLMSYRPATNRWQPLRRPRFVPPNPTVTWTGSRVIGWGGGCCGDFSGDGAEYIRSTNTWRRLPSSPLEPRQLSFGGWTGTEFIVAGGFTERSRTGVVRSLTFADAAAYTPTTRTWRRLPPMPAPRRDAVVVWTGRDLVVVGGIGRTAFARGVFAYRPATNTWRTLRPLPRGRSGLIAVWTGKRLLIWGGEVVRGGQPVAPTTGLSYNPAANRWSVIPAAPITGRVRPTAVWTGRSVIVAGGAGQQADRQTVVSFTPH